VIVGVGMDLVDIPRIARLLAEQGARAVQRLFTPAEAEYAQARAEPARHFAARFAAKEAAYKALSGTEHARGIGWRDLEVAVQWDGRPLLLLHGRARERGDELGLVRAHLTLTHADAVAGAVVVLEAAPPGLMPPGLPPAAGAAFRGAASGDAPPPASPPPG
jgi:holo-[acyl-carrier protein] synthase